MKMRVIERGGEITEKIWFDVYHPEVKDHEDKPISQGKVQMSFELMPKEESTKKVNALGREAPNNYPILPDPTGRFKFDLFNPLGMLKEILGPDLYRKVCIGICCIIIIPIIVFMGWQLLAVKLVI